MITTEKYTRKSFDVDAIQVTEDNIDAVAKWCMGEVRTFKTDPNDEGVSREQKYIKVRVFQAIKERQTKAFVGDWVLYAGTGYKVYTPGAFAKCFEPAAEKNTPGATVINVFEQRSREDVNSSERG